MLCWRGLCVLLCLLGAAPSLRADAPVGEEPVDAVEANEGAEPPAKPVTDSALAQALKVRLAHLRAAAKQADGVRTALEQADLALVRAKEARAQGQEARALRAEQIAEAATTLAELRLAWVKEREAMRTAQARRDDAQQMQRAAREALARAKERSEAEP